MRASLLHVVSHDNHRVVLLELVHGVLDLLGRDWVERARWLVHQDHLGLDRQGARDTKTLLLAAREPVPALLEAVFDLLPEGGMLQGALDQLVHVAAVAVDPGPPRHVLVDRLGERVGLLEDHPYAAPDDYRVRGPGVDVLLAEHHVPFGARAWDHLVHPVQTTYEGALAAPRRPDERRNLVGLDIYAHVRDGLEGAVERREVLDLHTQGETVARGLRRRPSASRRAGPSTPRTPSAPSRSSRSPLG